MKLHVQLSEARNLRPGGQPCNAYARLKLGVTKCRSAVCSNGSTSPTWFEDFTFNIDDIGEEVHISVWHQERFADVFLGRLRLPVAVVLHTDRLSISSSWYPLQKRRKRSKTPIKGEIRAGFVLSGRTSSSSWSSGQFPDANYASSMNSTPEHSSLSRTSSSDSLLSIMENAQENEISVPEYSSDVDGRDSDSYRGSFQFSQISTLLPSGVVSFFMQPSTKGQKLEEEESHAFPEKSLQSSEQELVPLSFFDDDDGVFELASETDLPAPLEGGILLARTYSVSAKVLNGIIFKPGSQFLKNLIDKQKSTDFSEGPWVKGGQGHPKRVITYVKAASKLVKSVKATEDQKYSRADKKGFVLDAVAVTPDAPYGKSFRVEIQYCIFARLDAASGERTCFLRVSWRVCFLTSTMMKRVIENGARQGLQDNFRDFEEILIKFAKPEGGSQVEPSSFADLKSRGHQCSSVRVAAR